MIKRWLLALALIATSSVAWAQNPTCPTRPVGDSTNACASTAFVQGAIAPFSGSGNALKAPVIAATTANITLSGAQTIDTVSVVAGDRVLVKDQSTASQNGIYIAAVGAWSRALDADTTGELLQGTMVLATQGSVNRNKEFVITTPNTITIGTTSIAWMTITVVHVNNYGAVCDNAHPTEDTAALQAALIALQQDTEYRGGKIIFPVGQCNITAAIAPTAYLGVINIWLEGQGSLATTLDFTSAPSNTDAFTWSGVHFGMKGMMINAARRDAIVVDSSSLYSFQDLRIQNSVRDGVAVRGGSYMGDWMGPIWATSNGRYGGNFGRGTSQDVKTFYAFTNTSDGIIIDDMAYSSFTGIASDNNGGVGIRVRNTVATAIQGAAEGNQGSGVVVETSTAIASGKTYPDVNGLDLKLLGVSNAAGGSGDNFATITALNSRVLYVKIDSSRDATPVGSTSLTVSGTGAVVTEINNRFAATVAYSSGAIRNAIGGAIGAPIFGSLNAAGVVTNDNNGVLGTVVPLSVLFGGTGIQTGTSGGIPYFSSTSQMASSGALTANLPVIGGGAGASPTVGTRSGNTTGFATFTGSTTSGRCVEWDASGNLVQSAAGCNNFTAAALTRVDDTNVTLTLGGTPSTALLQAASITAGWTGRLAYSRFTQGATNTVLANSTSGTADYAAFSMPSCSTAASALIWTTNTGFGCNTSITANAVAVGGITGLGTGVATWLATPSSANLAAALTDETGTGSAVFSASPTFTGTVNTALISASDTVTVSNSSSFFTAFNIIGTDAGGGFGPIINFRRDSASPAAYDEGGALLWQFRDSGANIFNAASVRTILIDPTNGSEDVSLVFTTSVAGENNATPMTVYAGVQIGAPTGTDKGAGTINTQTAYYANGTVGCTGTPTAATIGIATTCTSDMRLKNFDSFFTSGLSAIKGIKPINFHWKGTLGENTENQETGYSAQNIKENIPEAAWLAKQPDGREWYTVSDRIISATLINAVKELSDTNDELRKRLAKLEAANDNTPMNLIKRAIGWK